MERILVTQADVQTGSPIVVDSAPSGSRFAVVFEDDGDTGYFYGLDMSRGEQPIVDALHIYNARDQKGVTCPLKIAWSPDLLRAALYMGGVAQAAFDFGKRRAMCRSNFPPPDGTFTTTHAWDDSLLMGLG